MRVLVARYVAEPGRGDLVERTLKRMAQAVREQERACLLYRAARSTQDPDVFVLYEQYVDEEAVRAHRETAHYRELIEGIIVPALRSRDREVLVPVAP